MTGLRKLSHQLLLNPGHAWDLRTVPRMIAAEAKHADRQIIIPTGGVFLRDFFVAFFFVAFGAFFFETFGAFFFAAFVVFAFAAFATVFDFEPLFVAMTFPLSPASPAVFDEDRSFILEDEPGRMHRATRL